MTTKSPVMFACFLVMWTAACSAAAPLPPKALELNRTGAAALEAGDLETAGARLNLAIEYNPRFVEALTNLGLVEAERGNFTRARELLTRARRINPDVAQPHHGLGVLASREGRLKAASIHYRDALKIDPGFAPARANLARLYFDTAMYEHARVQFLRLTQVAPTEALGFTGLAATLLKLKRGHEAARVVVSGLEQVGSTPRLVTLLARIELRRGRIERATKLLEPLISERSSDGAEALAWLAVCELSRARRKRANRYARRALRVIPDQATALYVLDALDGSEVEPPASTDAPKR